MDFESDYVVEEHIKPAKVRVPLINDERADILGNFEDPDKKKSKKKPKVVDIGSEENPFADEEDEDDDGDDAEIEEAEEAVEDEDEEGESGSGEEDEEMMESNAEEADEARSSGSETEPSIVEPIMKQLPSKSEKKPSLQKKSKQLSQPETPTNTESGNRLSDDQITALMKGVSKKDRFVLYVTNINYETSKERLHDFFASAGDVKSVRIPKSRRTAFAFVEMSDLQSYRVSLPRIVLRLLALIRFSCISERTDVAQPVSGQLHDQSAGFGGRKEEVGQQEEHSQAEKQKASRDAKRGQSVQPQRKRIQQNNKARNRAE